MADLVYMNTQPEDEDELNEFLGRTFFHRDPMNLGLSMSWKDHSSWITNQMGLWTACNASFVVRDKTKGNTVVGVGLSKYATRDDDLTFDEALRKATGKTRAYLSILGELESSLIFEEEEGVDKILNLVFLCVDEDYARRGIATKLVQMCERLGKENGAQFAGVQATNFISQRIFTKLGYQVKKSVDYATYEVEGEKFFDPSLQGPTTCIQLLTKKL